MSVRYRSIGGGNRAWSVDTWAEWQSIAVANFRDGDTMWYGDGKVSLTRRNSRWRPDEEHLWGRNDATTPPFVGGANPGTVDSEGIWTMLSNPGADMPNLYGQWFDVLAIIMPDQATFNWGIAAATGVPTFVGIRAVVITTASSTLAVTARQNNSIYGGDSVSYGVESPNDVIYYGQGIVIPGGAGGLGADTMPGSGGESLWRPALTSYRDDLSYDISSDAQGPITIWGGTEHESRST